MRSHFAGYRCQLCLWGAEVHSSRVDIPARVKQHPWAKWPCDRRRTYEEKREQGRCFGRIKDAQPEVWTNWGDCSVSEEGPGACHERRSNLLKFLLASAPRLCTAVFTGTAAMRARVLRTNWLTISIILGKWGRGGPTLHTRGQGVLYHCFAASWMSRRSDRKIWPLYTGGQYATKG